MLCGPRVKMAPRRWAVLFADKCIDPNEHRQCSQSAPTKDDDVKLTTVPAGPQPPHISLRRHYSTTTFGTSVKPRSRFHPKSTKDGPALSSELTSELTPPAGRHPPTEEGSSWCVSSSDLHRCVEPRHARTHTPTHTRTHTTPPPQ